MKNVTGHEAACTVCQSKRNVDATVYNSFEKTPGIALEVLISSTFPGICEAYVNRLHLENKLINGTLTVEEKEAFILEVFQIFNVRTEENFHAVFQARGPGAWLFGITCFVIFVALIMISSSSEFSPVERGNFLSTLGILAITSILTSLILMILQPGRSFRKEIIPAMTIAFKTLNPSKEELAISLGKMDRSGYKIGKKWSLTSCGIPSLSRPNLTKACHNSYCMEYTEEQVMDVNRP